MKHLEPKKSYFQYMIPVRKLAIGLGLASGALLTAWLLTGERKQKTRSYIVKKGTDLKNTLKTKKHIFDDSEAHYI
jgi:hypothetical protein